MDDWTYRGPAELAGLVRMKVNRVSVNVNLAITIERDACSDLPPLKSWGGSAAVTDRTGDMFLDGKYTVTLPTGQSGEAYVHTSIKQLIGERELTLSLQGVGEPPWWSQPEPSV